MLKGRFAYLLVPALAVFLAACGTTGSVLSVMVSGEQLRLASGMSTALVATVETTGAASKEVTWSSSHEDVASVSASGVVLAKRAGITTISAASVANESKSSSVSITVLTAPAVSPIAPGEASAETGGVPASVTTNYESGTMALAVGGTKLIVGLEAGDGEALSIRAGGVPRVTADGSIALSGSGYAPSTPVDVWFFSEPTLLGSVATDGGGAFSATFNLPASVQVGTHTLVVEGSQPDGGVLGLRLGLEVEAGAAVVEFAHCPVGTDWFVSVNSGAVDADGSSVSTPFAAIQTAINAAEELDVVCVAAGTYAVDNSDKGAGGASIVLVRVDKPLSLIGPNVGVSGASPRLPEAELVVSSTEADTLYAIAIESSDVTVDGFYVGTNTPKTDPYPHGMYGTWVSSDATFGVAIRNNHMVDTNFPIWVNRGTVATPATGFVIEGNLIEGPVAASDQGILMQAAFGEIANNVIRDARVGIQVQPYKQIGAGAVYGNNIKAFQAGLWFNYQEDAGSSWVFDGNRVTGIESPWGWPLYNNPDTFIWSGIRVETFYQGTVTFVGNSVEAGAADTPADGGIYLLRQRSVSGSAGSIHGIGTLTELGEFFTANAFPDFGIAGVTVGDLAEEGGLIQLLAPVP